MGSSPTNLELNKEKPQATTSVKRRKGLKKKIYELSTLCGVDACMIICEPTKLSDGSIEADTWPEDKKEVNRILGRYQKYNKEEERNLDDDVTDTIKDQKKKLEDEVSAMRRKNNEVNHPKWDGDWINGLCKDRAMQVLGTLDSKTEMIQSKIKLMKEKERFLEIG